LGRGSPMGTAPAVRPHPSGAYQQRVTPCRVSPDPSGSLPLGRRIHPRDRTPWVRLPPDGSGTGSWHGDRGTRESWAAKLERDRWGPGTPAGFHVPGTRLSVSRDGARTL